MRFSKARCFELMNDALGAPARFGCGRDVEHIRQRFYRARQWCQARDDYRFDGLKFQIDGSTLVISKRPIPAARQLRAKLAVLKEMRDIVARSDMDVHRLADGAERKGKKTMTRDHTALCSALKFGDFNETGRKVFFSIFF